MKKYELDLTAYTVVVPRYAEGGKVETQDIVYPLRENISHWLRTVGIFKSANDVAEAVTLAKALLATTGDAFKLDEREAEILRTAMDKLIELTAEGRANLGGELHEEAILRVVNMKEIED